MKRLLLSLTVLVTPLGLANATPELAAQWGHDAAALHIEVDQQMRAVKAGIGGRGDVPEHFAEQVYRFSIDAEKLGRWIDQTPDTADLGCIFRGMAEEADVQLRKLETAQTLAASASALERLEKLFDDAEAISAAALSASGANAMSAHSGCKAGH